jgi:hypothetical protein
MKTQKIHQFATLALFNKMSSTFYVQRLQERANNMELHSSSNHQIISRGVFVEGP